MTDQTEAKKTIDIAFTLGLLSKFDPKEPHNYALTPEGFQLHDLEDFQDAPRRHRIDYVFSTVGSLVTYLNRFATEDTLIFAEHDASVIRATIDGHTPGEPSFGDHKVAFSATLSEKLRDWKGKSNKALSQVDFGLFLEERAIDVVKPDAADVFDMVMQFSATKKVDFKSQTRLSNGDRQVQWVEETSQTRGGMTLPDHFVIRVPVFEGMEPQDVKIWVRYAIREGALMFTLKIHDEKQLIDDAFQRCIDAVKVGMKLDLPIYDME